MTACRHCADLKRQYGWACEDLRDAARKLVRSGGNAELQVRVDDAKARKRSLAERLNEHREKDHREDVA